MAPRVRHVALLIALIVAAGATEARAQGGKPTAPVEVSSDPLRLKENEQGTLRVHVVALAAVDRLEISITASTGVALTRPVTQAAFSKVRSGERHDFQVPVRLIASDFGYVSIAMTTTISGVSERQFKALTVGTMPAAPARVPVGTDENLADLTLLKVAGPNAVVRFGNKELIVVKAGDQLGRNKAELLEVAADRIVLDETFVGPDGRPNRARITVKEGATGGTRVLVRPGEEAPPATQIQVIPGPRGPSR